ncbi:hypothetical protein NQD34_009713 [Periophthalmus magnuspinnatus]|nr:hypothetical protein NQD34_009713 [Periophthalmus magnuspinnatus]
MNGAAFPSPTSEMAEINRIQYELDYTEGISQRMRVPEMLKVAPEAHDDPITLGSQNVHSSVIMQVPDRIVVTGDNSKKTFSGTRDLDFIQSTPFDTLSLKTPPRVLTLSDRPLDFLEDEQRAAPDTDDTMRHQGRMRRERSASENMSVRPSGLTHNDSASPASSSSATTDPSNPCLTMADEEHNLYSASGVLSFIQSTTRRAYQQVLEVLDESPHRLALSTYEASFDAGTDDLTMVDAATLRRQLIKLNRRLQLLEEENKERVKREMILYSITVAFWLVNTWVWLRR